MGKFKFIVKKEFAYKTSDENIKWLKFHTICALFASTNIELWKHKYKFANIYEPKKELKNEY